MIHITKTPILKTTEKEIENSILEYLKFSPGFIVYKKNNGAVYDPKKKTFRKSHSEFQPNGVSDLYGSHYGRAVYIEVKKPCEYKYIMKHYEELRCYMGVDAKRNRYKEQIEFIEVNRESGCMAFFSDSIEMTKQEIAKQVNNFADRDGIDIYIKELNRDEKEISGKKCGEKGYRASDIVRI